MKNTIPIILLTFLPFILFAQKDRIDSLTSKLGDEIVYSNTLFDIHDFHILGKQKYILNENNELILLDTMNRSKLLTKIKFKGFVDPIIMPYQNDGIYISNFNKRNKSVLIDKNQKISLIKAKPPGTKVINHNEIPLPQEKKLFVTYRYSHRGEIDKTVVMLHPNNKVDTLYKNYNRYGNSTSRNYSTEINAIYCNDKIYVFDEPKKIFQIHDLEGKLLKKLNIKAEVPRYNCYMKIDQANGKVYFIFHKVLFYLDKNDKLLKQNITRTRIHQIYNNEVYYSEYKDGIISVHKFKLN